MPHGSAQRTLHMESKHNCQQHQLPIVHSPANTLRDERPPPGSLSCRFTNLYYMQPICGCVSA